MGDFSVGASRGDKVALKLRAQAKYVYDMPFRFSGNILLPVSVPEKSIAPQGQNNEILIG